jgi:two-component system, LytTR family, response regulator LytT
MKVVIIEDEAIAARRLQKLIQELEPDTTILALLDSVEGAVKWCKENVFPDLFFMDIQLADGLSFEIFEKVEIKSPVIFTTAFDEYAIKAFEVNSIDYLLKPLEKEALARALKKFKQNEKKDSSNLKSILSELITGRNNFKERFLVKKGDSFIPLAISDIAYFYAEEKVVFAKSKNAQRYLIEYTLDNLEASLNPDLFYRVNRQMLVSVDSVQLIKSSFNGKLKAIVDPAFEQEIIISREKAQDFKNWLGKK